LASGLQFNWEDDRDGRGAEAYSELGDFLQTNLEHQKDPPGPDGWSRVRHDLPPIGWGYGVWTNEPFEDEDGQSGNHRDYGNGDGDLLWQGDNGKTIYPTHDEAKAAAEAHFHGLNHRSRSRGGGDSGVDYESLMGPGQELNDDYGDIFGERS